jgi:hypothetical protein
VKTTVEIIGMEQIHEVLDGLPKRINKQLLNQAAKKSVKPIVEAAITNVPSETVKKQIKTWNLTRSPFAGVWAGWNSKKRKADYEAAQTRAQKAWAWMGGFWLEYGTTGKWRRSERICRKIEPIGWFRRAVDMNIDKVENSFMKDLLNVINKFLDKKIKKYGW